MKDNVVLIGMPGCGKSTVGVLLAKALGKQFVDTDVVLQAREGMLLQDMLDGLGIDPFLDREADAVCALPVRNAVIATGGSVIYRQRSVEHLQKAGVLVYLQLPMETILKRVNNLATRGVALRPGETLADEYRRRHPLYLAAADRLCSLDGLDMEASVRAIRRALGE